MELSQVPNEREPREVESEYKYEDGLDYYQFVKDADYLFEKNEAWPNFVD